MEITLRQTGKRYRYDWIFRRLDYHFKTDRAYAVTGPNGSGKSTLLRVLSGFLTPSEGDIAFSLGQKLIAPDQVYRYISYAAPYIELIEEFTLLESLRFQAHFRPWRPGLGENDLLQLLQLPKAHHQAIRYFSSGMKQRLKLLLAVCADTPVLLLDEPSTNLDQAGMDWYLSLVQQHSADRLVVIASNSGPDYSFCQQVLDITQYKPGGKAI